MIVANPVIHLLTESSFYTRKCPLPLVESNYFRVKKCMYRKEGMELTYGGFIMLELIPRVRVIIVGDFMALCSGGP